MQYQANTPEEYLTQLVDDWRKEKLHIIRNWIIQHAPEVQESIEYKMLRFGNKQHTLFHLNTQKNYVSLYVGDTKKVDSSGELLRGLDCGKGCIRIKKSSTLESSALESFIKQAVIIWRQGNDLAC